jgi:diguanylate cyclase (GGDEF)-like protein/PAS domain S-box-containing protein/putative nucleotidyltransferase with HDIG domain
MRKKCSQPKAAAAQKKAGQKLTDLLTYAVMNSPTTVVVTGADGTIEFVNRKFCSLTGYSPSEAIGQKASLLKSGLMSKQCYLTLWRRLKKGLDWTGEFHNRKKSGEFYWEQASITPVRDAAGHLCNYLKIAEDITERKRLESDLRKSVQTLKAKQAELQATCRDLEATTRALKKSQNTLQRLSQEDTLTGLLNRRGFYSELGRVKALAERQGQSVGFLVIDIDYFKKINDLHGHAAGDRILKACAKLFRSRLRSSDLLCRFGGDEIVIALPSSGIESTRRTAERILTAVRQHAFSTGGKTKISVTVSIGAACGIPVPSQPLDPVMKRADQALYRVKRSGRNGVAFETSDDDPTCEPTAADTVEHPAIRLPLAVLNASEEATAAHCRRVAQMAGALARALSLPPGQVELITQCALLHDIGKIAIPDTVLLKPGPLVQEHPTIGCDILQSNPDLKAFSEIVLTHHERLDGSGYPRGLKGKRIGLEARILAVADTYDAIRAERPYAKPRPADVALSEIQRCRGTYFDPEVVDALVRCQSELEAVLSADAPAPSPKPLKAAGRSSSAKPRGKSRP